MLLVISDMDDVSDDQLSKYKVKRMMLIVSSRDVSYLSLKRQLIDFCNKHFIEFFLGFIIPQMDVKPSVKFLEEYGKLYDQDVIVYDK